MTLKAGAVFVFKNTWDGTLKSRYSEEYEDEAIIEKQMCFLADYTPPMHCTDPNTQRACADAADLPCGISK